MQLLCNRISTVASWSCSDGCLAVMQFAKQVVSRGQQIFFMKFFLTNFEQNLLNTKQFA